MAYIDHSNFKGGNYVLPTSISAKWYLKRLDEVIKGERDAIPDMPKHKEGAAFFSRRILRAFFEHRLGWTPEEVQKKLSKKIMKDYRLDLLIENIPCPEEFDRDKSLCFVAWFLYPNLKPSPEKLTKYCFAQILSGRRKSFPKGYFSAPYGRGRAVCLFQTMLTKMPRRFTDVDEMYRFFASDDGLQCIKTWCLTEALKEVYNGDPLAYLHDSIPYDRSAELYWFYHLSMKKLANTNPPIEILEGANGKTEDLFSGFEEIKEEKAYTETVENMFM